MLGKCFAPAVLEAIMSSDERALYWICQAIAGFIYAALTIGLLMFIPARVLLPPALMTVAFVASIACWTNGRRNDAIALSLILLTCLSYVLMSQRQSSKAKISTKATAIALSPRRTNYR